MIISAIEVRIGQVSVPSQEPSESDFKRRFTCVDSVFGQRAFLRTEDLVDVQFAPEVEMSYISLQGESSTEEALAEIRRRKLRSALYEELLGYYQHWDEQLMSLEHWMRLTVSLGSYTILNDKQRGVAVLSRNNNFLNCPDLRVCHYNGPWPSYTRFLAVRE